MSEHNHPSERSPISNFCSTMYFTQIFRGFRMAIHPSKMILALAGVIVIYLAGSLLDGLTPGHLGVVNKPALISSKSEMNHLEAYVRNGQDDAGLFNQRVIQAIDVKLERLLANSDSLSGKDVSTDQIKDAYHDHLDDSIVILKKRFGFRESYIWDQYKNNLEQINRKDEAVDRLKRQRDEDLKAIEAAYQSLFHVVVHGASELDETERWIRQLIVADDRTQGKMLSDEQRFVDNDRVDVRETILLAQIWQLTKAGQGQGVFATLKDFYGQRAMTLVTSLVLEWDLPQAKQAISDSLMGLCWLSRYHCVYGFFLLLIWLATWSIFGGAICRIAALQFTQDERISPFRALKFSCGKFFSFFTAPLMPLLIIALLALLMYLISLIGAVPAIGEILASLLLGLALVGGFIMALVAVGLIGGVSLMVPTIAVEGSDNFDSISRSFSYVLGRPWHMTFYTLVALVYGSICFLFVRLFVFILLLSVRVPMQAAMNVDGSSKINIRGKLDAIWPIPSFSDLHPNIDFASLGGSESLSAFFIWVWVSIAIGLTVAFVASFHFSVNTIIYILLRKQVDSTDFDDVYIEEPEEQLLEQNPDAALETERASEIPVESPPQTTIEQTADDTNDKPTGDSV